VPGPWSAADIAFQAEHVATQKLHNAGFNCIASQVLVLPETWTLTKTFAKAVKDALGQSEARPLYYPNSSQRLAKFNLGEPDQASRAATVTSSNQCLVTTFQPGANASVETTEVFAPALGMTQLPGASAEEFLVNAVAYANTRLPGTLGANILIHPKTRAEIGKKRFEEILQSLRYGTIAINAWTGLGFLSPQASWGAFPGHTPEDVQSGIGLVHNAMLFDAVERTVVEAPFRPFPRNLLSLSFTMLPRPPWFVTNKRSDKIGALLTEFQYRPSFLKLPAIFYHALQG
jgi:aldehyde dehydrogenase (NAD(P)+)